MRLLLPAALRIQAVAAAQAAAPCEACGLIEGMRDGDGFAAAALHLCPNLAGPGRFVIDPAVHIGLQRRLRDGPTKVIGCFHTHPNGAAAPSAADREAGDFGYLWLIMGGGGDVWELAAFLAPDFMPLILSDPA